MNKLDELQRIIDGANNIVFFGGAGVSTESGIPDFRSTDGIYNQIYDYPPEEIVSHHFFVENTEYFYKFYFDKLVYDDVLPNQCHIKLAKLEKNGKLKAIVTQNIDNLHELAGSKNVIHLHGNIQDNYCRKCGKYYKLDKLDRKNIPKCSCGGIIKPDVVLYEEPLKDENVKNAIKYISEADTLIIGGTSLNVYPAAGLIRYFNGKTIIIINKDKLNQIGITLEINEPIGEVFSKIKV